MISLARRHPRRNSGTLSAMPITPIACLSDNYAYAVFSEGKDRARGAALVVDPSEPGPVIACLDGLGLRLGGLLLTHHHWDHVGGVAALLGHLGEVPVVAHGIDGAHIRGVTQTVVDGASFELAGQPIDVMHVPGHTLGAVAYRWQNAVFTGDTLFAAGCGRLFEGTAAQMYASLSRLAALPSDTKIYCGHEYALRNLAFARSVEPGNGDVTARIEHVSQLRDARRPSVPSTIAEELTTNPFLRCDSEQFRERAAVSPSLSGAELFAELRRRRDGF
jgi:hydroxyacylglutathione hydrolase